VNGLTPQKLATIIAYIKGMDIDIFVMIDTRETENEGKYTSRRVKKALGRGTVVVSSPVRTEDRSFTGVRPSGGITAIVNSKWGLAVVRTDHDKAKLGLLLSISVRHELGELRVIGTYWPTNNGSESDKGLWNRTLRWMRESEEDGNPLDYIQKSLTKWDTQHRLRGKSKGLRCNTLIGGDLNSTMHPGERGGNHNALSSWCQTMQLENIGDVLSRNTHTDRRATRFSADQPNSVIDHILINGSHLGTRIQAYAVDHNACWESVSDHRPIWTVLDIRGKHAPNTVLNITPLRKKKILRLTTLARGKTCPNQLKRYHSQIDKWISNTDSEYWRKRIDRQLDDGVTNHEDHRENLTELDDTVEQIPNHDILCEAYTEVTNMIKTAAKKSQGNSKRPRRQLRSSYKDGWSPSYYAYKINLDMLIEIRRHIGGRNSLIGQYKRRRWKAYEIQSQIREKVNRWEQRVKSLFHKSGEAEAVLSIISKPPSVWRTMSYNNILTDIEADIKHLKSKMTYECRLIKESEIGDRTRARQQACVLGKMGRVCSSMLLTEKDYTPVDAAYFGLEKKLISEKDEFHKGVTEFFDKEWFGGFPKGLCGIDTSNWATILASEQQFKAEYTDPQKSNIPKEYVDLLWKAITTIERSPEMTQELETAANVSLQEWIDAVRHAKKAAHQE
jgi:hypothetical protein